MGGQEAQVVENGTATWGEGMLNSDPLFAGRIFSDYYLAVNSPCIDTGDPDPLQNDPDETPADMGAFYYDQAGSGMLSIYEIQYTEESGPDNYYPSLYVGETVMTTGIVTAIGYAGNDNNFFITSPEVGIWNSLYLYASDVTPQPGDEITATGEITEYYGFTEMYHPEIVIINSDNPIPDPVIVNTGDLVSPAEAEQYESCLVTVHNVTVVTGPDGNNQWYVDDNSGACQVDDKFFHQQTEVDDYFSAITGLLDYNFYEYGLNPRFAQDLVAAEAVTLWIDDLEMLAYQTDVVEISLENGQPVLGFQIELIIDPQVAEILSTSATVRTEGWSITFNENLILGFTLEQVEIAPGNGPIIDIELLANTVGAADMCLENLVISTYGGIQLPAQAPDCGSLFVAAGIPGDLDGNGSVNVIDIVMTIDIIFGADATDYQLWAADLDSDGDVNVMDIVLIVTIILDGSL